MALATTSLIDAARSIGPIVREHNAQAERERRLSGAVLNALHDSGLTRMLTPRSLGGLETDRVTRTRVVEEISRHDTAAGWTLENPLDWAYFCARLPDQGAEEIFSRGADILIAAQFGRPFERTFRDAQTLQHHAFAAEGRYETVGKVYLGIEPDFPAVEL